MSISITTYLVINNLSFFLSDQLLYNCFMYLKNGQDQQRRAEQQMLSYLPRFYNDFCHTVPHKLLIWKLESYRIAKDIISWINSFLDQRCFCVNVIYSDFKTVASGILQCIVLGPILLVPTFWSYKFFCTSMTYLTNFHPIATCLLTTQKYSVKQR